MSELPKECLEWLDYIKKEYGEDEARKLQGEAEYYVSQGFDYLGNVPNVTPDDVPVKTFNNLILVPPCFNIGQFVKVLSRNSNTCLQEGGTIIDIKWNVRLNARRGGYLFPSYKIQRDNGNIYWSDEVNLVLCEKEK